MNDQRMEAFLNLIREQFSEKQRHLIHPDTDIKQLHEWTSLQTMIIVNEIDKHYGVVLDVDELREAHSIEALYDTVERKK